MSYALRLRKTPRERIAAAVKGASAKLGLDPLVDRKPRALSGGQRQRVAMGRAIVREPKAFLFDEPLSNLDARLREQMRFEIRKLHRDLGATSVYVTHDQIEAMTMADRIVAMNEGIAQQIGAPSELYDNPANLFVAGFIGSPAMNFLQASARPLADGLALTIGDATLVNLPPSMSPPATGKVIIGLRPERISLGEPGQGAIASVDLVEPTGLGMIIHLVLAGQLLKTFTTERLTLQAGERVGIVVRPESVRLFDPVSGVRLVQPI
jgi:multiple sugar transport system ATP-binding protein